MLLSPSGSVAVLLASALGGWLPSWAVGGWCKQIEAVISGHSGRHYGLFNFFCLFSNDRPAGIVSPFCALLVVMEIGSGGKCHSVLRVLFHLLPGSPCVAVCVVRDACYLLVKSCCLFALSSLSSWCLFCCPVFQQQLKLATVFITSHARTHTRTLNSTLFNPAVYPLPLRVTDRTHFLSFSFHFSFFSLSTCLCNHCQTKSNHFGYLHPTCFYYCFSE